VGTAGLSCALAVSASNSAQDAISSLRKGMAIPGLFVGASLLATESERKQPSPAACLVGTLVSSMDRDLPKSTQIASTASSTCSRLPPFARPRGWSDTRASVASIHHIVLEGVRAMKKMLPALAVAALLAGAAFTAAAGSANQRAIKHGEFLV